MDAQLQIALQMFVDHFTKSTGKTPSLDDINDFLRTTTESLNNAPRDNFEGYSPEQMHCFLDLLWSSASPIVLKELSDEEYMQMPLFRQIMELTSILTNEGKIKLTTTGALPLAVVRKVYSVGVPDKYIENRPNKRLTESDSESVQLTVVMLKILSATKIQKGVMTLTARGKKLLKDKRQLISELLQIFTYQFNWAYFDRFDDEDMDVGRTGVGFSLAMVAKYGSQWKRDNFYAKKYFEAFPMLAMDRRWSEEVPGENCYTIRTFERFMLEFGLIEMKDEEVPNNESSLPRFNIHTYIRKSDLFDKIFTFK